MARVIVKVMVRTRTRISFRVIVKVKDRNRVRLRRTSVCSSLFPDFLFFSGVICMPLK